MREQRRLESLFRRADQIAKAVRYGYVKTPPVYRIPREEPARALRDLIVRAVYAYWNVHRKPMHITRSPAIYEAVLNRIRTLKQMGEWPWKIPIKRTIDRRVNECADKRIWDGPTPLIGLGGGWYMPNPAKFEEPTRSELLRIVRRWKLD